MALTTLGAASNKDEALDIIRDYAEANPDLKIVFGMGWSADMLGGWPTMADLEALLTCGGVAEPFLAQSERVAGGDVRG